MTLTQIHVNLTMSTLLYNQNCNMPRRYKQLSQLAGDNTRNTVSFLIFLKEQNVTRVRNHESQEFLTLRSIIILELSPVMPFVVLQN